MVNVYTYLENLFQQSYTLPTIIATVSIAVLITLFQDRQEQKKEKANASAKELEGDKKEASSSNTSEESPAPKPKAFALPTTPLPPPNLERIFTKEELAEHDGEKEDGTIYVAIKGIVFDVTAKKAMYGPSGGYHCFAGKDASKALGKSSLKPEDCIADYSELTEKERKTMEDWYVFFEKRYAIIGRTEA
ncbi:hypothetical protein EC957_011362 [Mortierella hygrophila]|uniref:Cytochrome b5 heme-binding domain-containing protein n=1 Tax=Mortierella hygrophila TaxID=979708 RepID=A0A9P6FI78_9FUNG|nr:hypothetical protein EC957_011362 [Mortierella hygrophila]